MSFYLANVNVACLFLFFNSNRKNVLLCNMNFHFILSDFHYYCFFLGGGLMLFTCTNKQRNIRSGVKATMIFHAVQSNNIKYNKVQ